MFPDITTLVSSQPLPEPKAIFLPNELILKIFVYLKESFRSFHQASLVSRQWRTVADAYLSPALRRLCLCSHQLTIGEDTRVENKNDFVVGLLDTQNEIHCFKTLQPKFFFYELATKKRFIMMNDCERFLAFMDGKLFHHLHFNKLNYFDAITHKNIELELPFFQGAPFFGSGTMLATKNEQDKRLAFTYLQSKQIRIYDCITQSFLTLERSDDSTQRCLGLVFAGDRLVEGYETGYDHSGIASFLKIYDAEGKAIAEKQFEHPPVHMQADKDHLAVFFSNNTIKLLDAHTLEERRTLEATALGLKVELGGILLWAFELQKGQLYTIVKPGVFKVFDVATGKILREFKRSDGSPFNICHHAMAIQGTTIALGVKLAEEKYAVELWDFETGELVQSYPVPDPITKVILKMEEEPKLVVGTCTGLVHVWSPALEKQKMAAKAPIQ